jgi:hypothetical protein
MTNQTANCKRQTANGKRQTANGNQGAAAARSPPPVIAVCRLQFD